MKLGHPLLQNFWLWQIFNTVTYTYCETSTEWTLAESLCISDVIFGWYKHNILNMRHIPQQGNWQNKMINSVTCIYEFHTSFTTNSNYFSNYSIKNDLCNGKCCEFLNDIQKRFSFAGLKDITKVIFWSHYSIILHLWKAY